MIRGRHSRSGVALIIAISVLAALLFLALPFVFSQTASMAGARASSWDGAARRGSDRAMGLGTALATYATGLHRSPQLVQQLGTGQFAYVQLPMQIGDLNGPIHYPSDAPNSWRTILDTASPWMSTMLPGLDGTGVVHGVSIEDESRRIDPNNLDMYGWAVVLKRAGIQDPWTVEMSWEGAHTAAGVWVPAAPNFSWHMVTFGRLARALTYWRPNNGSRRFNRLEDLLGADPEQPEEWYGVNSKLGCVHFGPMRGYTKRGESGWPTPGQTVEGTRDAAEVSSLVKAADLSQLGWRVAPLTQAELERLRPLLSFLVPGQGRSGLIDVGTVVAAETRTGDWWSVVTDELDPPDTGMVGGPLRNGLSWVHAWHKDSLSGEFRMVSGRHYNNGWSQVGAPLAVDAIPAMNINTVPSVSGMTRLYLAQGTSEADTGSPSHQERIEALGWPEDPIDTPITSIGRMPLLRWLDPRTGDGTTTFDRPPLGIAGFGIVAMEGLSTVRDAQGNAVASRRRRTVIQAVPQERPLEAAWTTQGDFEALVRLRHGSWVVAGPHPTNRIHDWGVDAGTGRQDMLALNGPGWLEPAPMTSFGRNPSVNINWRVPFGLTKAQLWNDVLKQVDASGVPGTNATDLPIIAPSTSLRASGTNPGALTAQGLRLDAGDRIAYGASEAAGGPLLFNVNGNERELAARHVSLRFSLPNDPVGTVTLVEARNRVAARDTSDPVDWTPDAQSEHQSLWRVEYRPADRQLVLVIANAALPWTAGDRTRYGVSGWTTLTDLPSADADARCRPGGLAFAPADPAERVEFRYLVAGGLQKGRWYHLQVFCASDRPGLHGLILDGVVGRDATQAIAGAAQTGDHYTYPSLRLRTAIAMVTPSAATDPAAELAKPSQIEVGFPSTLTIAQLLPPRGIVRIDDEYISYTAATDSGPGTGTLTGVQRARRVNTDQTQTEDLDGDGALDTEDANGNGVLDGSEDANGNTVLDTEDTNKNGLLDTITDARRWPVTQRHEVGAIVTPGWAQTVLSTGRWLRGSARLVQPMQPLPAEGVVNIGWPLSAGDPLLRDTAPATVTLATQTGIWPTRGMIGFDIGGQVRRAAFTAAGTTLTLDWAGPGASGVPNEFAAGTDITCRVVSIEVDAAIQHNTIVQLLKPDDGRCEWIRIDAQADRTGQTIDGIYLLHDGGWSMTAYATPQPLVQPRGAMRTGWTAGDPAWATGTQVLPVQTGVTPAGFDTDRFESGDAVTLVPLTIDDGGSARLPVQVVVRHACRDGYPNTLAGSGARWDTRNEWFALAHPVPANLPDPQPVSGTPTPLRALIGRGWGGDDLSPEANSPQRRGAMPRLRLLVTADGDRARVLFGSADSDAGSTANGSPVVIDDLCSGPLQGPADANAAATPTQVNGSEVIEIGGSPTGAITTLPVRVRASENVFTAVDGRSQYGIALIDGEAFAFRRTGDNASADLIARALLGTVAVPHTLATDAPTVPWSGGASTSRAVRPTLPIVVLPVGPVAELCSPLAAGAHNVGVDVVEALYANYYKDPVDFDTPHQESYADDPRLIMNPPFVLLHHPSDGATVEITRLHMRPASRQRITARWLRGLYGTPDTSWSAPYTPSTHVAPWSPTDPGPQPVAAQSAGDINPVVIGWWPRFAPGVTANPAVEVLRSRSFAWAGFALRVSGSRFDPYGVPVLAAAAGGIADVGVADDAGCTLTASALAAQEATGTVFDWDNAWAKRATLTSPLNDKLVDPFNWDRFQLREVDGAELRVHWAATGSGASNLQRAADAVGRAPRLQNIRLRCVAPNRVLAVEEVR